MIKRVTCDRCRGCGHDKKGLPVIEFREHYNEDGELERKHTTVKQGSGCMKCLGLGYIEK